VSASDAVVVGAGHNGLVAAILLAKAGWSVTVLERSDEPGGAIRTAEVTLPGFKHDLYAANLNLFMGSAFFREHGDEVLACGFEPVVAHRPFGSVFPGGRFVGVSTDSAETVAAIRDVSEADAAAWQELAAWFARHAPALFPLLGTAMPSLAAARALLSGMRKHGRRWPLELSRLVTQSSRELVEEHFQSRELQALVAAWGMHLDFPPDVPGGALFALLETFAGAANGMVLGRGGARSLVDALAAMLERNGGTVICGAEVERIDVAAGRATAAVTAAGVRYVATKAVVANLTPRALFGPLVPLGVLPAGFRRAVRGYRYAPGTMMVHLALEELPRWVAGDHVRGWSYVHVGPYLDDMSLAYQQAVAAELPERPTLVVGQPTAVDASRAPDGKAVLWVQVRVVPRAIPWAEASESYADHVLALLDEYAPGLGNRILGRHVISPLDLERANPSLVGGDQLGGSMHPSQNFFLRPFPGWSRYATPIDGLYLCGAGTWPGAGVGAGSGYLLGKELTRRRRLLRR
jgi:phytoene dehydrogenase-like protein